MTECLLVCRSQTYAQRTQRALERAGLRSHITRNKPRDDDRGCGHAVKIPEGSLERALELLHERDLMPQKILTVLEDGSVQERQS